MERPWNKRPHQVGVVNLIKPYRSNDLYHTARWTREAAAFKVTHPLCEECRSKGILSPAEVVDHIIPWPVCGESGFWNRNNWRSLCQRCNIAKGNRDKAIIRQFKMHRLNDNNVTINDEKDNKGTH